MAHSINKTHENAVGYSPDSEPFLSVLKGGFMPMDRDPDITWVYDEDVYRAWRTSTSEFAEDAVPDLVVLLGSAMTIQDYESMAKEYYAREAGEGSVSDDATARSGSCPHNTAAASNILTEQQYGLTIEHWDLTEIPPLPIFTADETVAATAVAYSTTANTQLQHPAPIHPPAVSRIAVCHYDPHPLPSLPSHQERLRTIQAFDHNVATTFLPKAQRQMRRRQRQALNYDESGCWARQELGQLAVAAAREAEGRKG